MTAASDSPTGGPGGAPVVTVTGRDRSFVLWPVWVFGLVVSLAGLAWNAQQATLAARAQKARDDKVLKEFPELAGIQSQDQRQAVAYELAAKLYGRGYAMTDDKGQSLGGDAYRRTTRDWLAENALVLGLLALSLGWCGLWAGLNFLSRRLPRLTVTPTTFRVLLAGRPEVVLSAADTRVDARPTPALLGSVAGLGGGDLVLVGAHGEIAIPHVPRLRRKLEAIAAVRGPGPGPHAATP